MKQFCIFLFLVAMVAVAKCQTLQSVSPDDGTRGTQFLQLVISGSDLDFNQGTATQVILSHHITGFEIYGYNFSSGGASLLYTDIDIPYNADTGLYDLNIEDTQNHISLAKSFEVLAQSPAMPTMNISPDAGTINTSVSVSVSGHLTHFTDNVSFYLQLPGGGNFIPFATALVSNDSEATARFFLLGLAPGVYNFYAQDARDNLVLSTNQFTVEGLFPQLVSATPDSSEADTTLEVNISGLNTNFTSATNTQILWLDHDGFIIYPVTATASDNTLILSQFTIPPDAVDGYYDVHTFDFLDGELALSNGFYIYGGVLEADPLNANTAGLHIFPNPAADHVTVALNLQQAQWGTFSVFNTSGQMVARKRVFTDAGKSDYNLDVSMFDEGFYILSYTGGEQELHAQFIIAR
jgi:hypothetical protein